MTGRCPNCRNPVGLWAVFSAMRPDRIRCPHCAATLRFRDTSRVRTLMVAITGVLGVAAAVFASRLGLGLSLAAAASTAILAWVVLEALVSWCLLRRRELEVVGLPDR